MGKTLFTMGENSEAGDEGGGEGEGQPSKGHLLSIFVPSSLLFLEPEPSVCVSTTRLKSGELQGHSGSVLRPCERIRTL